MRFFHQAARRAAVLLLCLSMLTGMLIPAFAATTDPATETPAHNLVYTDNQDENHDPIYKVWLTDDGVSGGCGGGSGETEDGYVVAPIYAGATPEFRFGSEKPTEPVVLTVFERYEGEAAVVAKTYTLSELKALAQTEVVGYQHWKNGSEKVIASNLYATVGSLLADAGVEFGAGDAVTAADPTDFTSTLTYEDSGVYKYYVNEDGVTEVPAAILISWNTGSGTPEDIAKTAYISGSLRFAYGITEQQYADQSAQGKRLTSNVVTLTVTHPERVVLTVYEQDEGGKAKEVKSYKPSELAALATEGAAGYQFWKKGEAQLVAATQYVTMNDLLTDAGVTFSDLDTLKAAAADGFSSELTYADNETYRYYITEDGKTEVPAILALTWASGSGTLEEVAAAAKNTGSLRFCYGISEQQYADQSAQGKRLASNIATITVVHGTKAEEPWVNPFRDVTESDWFYDGVRFANQNGLFNGVEKDLFAPEEPMTRGMLVTVLWRLDGETAPKTATTFTDVDANAYYADAVAWAAESGVVNGIGGNKFDPEGNVTREQIAAILFRYAAFKGVDTAARADLTAFPDAEKTSAYARDALSWAVAAELVKGTKEGSTIYLDPQGSATRAQVAAILSRYAQNIVK